MKITAISDTHNLHRHFGTLCWPLLGPGDILIHCGDITTRGSWTEYINFLKWFGYQRFAKKIFIAGNHDGALVNMKSWEDPATGVVYLNNSTTDYLGVRIYGSPIHNALKGDFYFGRSESGAAELLDDAPAADIVVTHGPAMGLCDDAEDPPTVRDEISAVPPTRSHIGLRAIGEFCKRTRPRLHLFGHTHNPRSFYAVDSTGTVHINCSVHHWLWKKEANQVPVNIEYL
jgi:predicted phosphodiesterase